MKSKLPRQLDLAIKRLAQEQTRGFYAEARKALEREAVGAIRGGASPESVTAQMLKRTIRASIAGIVDGPAMQRRASSSS